MIYAKKALRERSIPFEINAPRDPFYSKENMDRIEEAKEQIQNGQVVVKTFAQLEDMANE